MKLSLCIPTYNRAEHLAKRLGELKVILAALPPGKVELVVCDNGSPDNTLEVARSFEGTLPNYRIVSNPLNLGADYNFIRCMLQARGEYIWLFSDDDHFLPHSVKTVLDLLNAKQPDVLICNQSVGSTYSARDALGERMYPIAEDAEGKLYDLCTQFGYLTLLGFVSAIVLKRPEFAAEDWVRHQNYETALVHSTIVFEAHYNGRAVVTAEPLLHVEPPASHQTRDHQSAQDPRVNFYTWTLNLSVFFRDLMLRGVKLPALDEKFFIVPHCKMPVIDHILGSLRNSTAELREINNNSWSKVESLLKLVGDEGRLDYLRRLRSAHDSVLAQLTEFRKNPAACDQLRAQLERI